MRSMEKDAAFALFLVLILGAGLFFAWGGSEPASTQPVGAGDRAEGRGDVEAKTGLQPPVRAVRNAVDDPPAVPPDKRPRKQKQALGLALWDVEREAAIRGLEDAIRYSRDDVPNAEKEAESAVGALAKLEALANLRMTEAHQILHREALALLRSGGGRRMIPGEQAWKYATPGGQYLVFGSVDSQDPKRGQGDVVMAWTGAELPESIRAANASVVESLRVLARAVSDEFNTRRLPERQAAIGTILDHVPQAARSRLEVDQELLQLRVKTIL